jgi:hypothetical protein
MPESPDFDRIAEQWCFNEETDTVPEMEARRAEFVVVLKSVWNARGAADIATIEHGLPDVWTAAAPVGALTRVLRRLDR